MRAGKSFQAVEMCIDLDLKNNKLGAFNWIWMYESGKAEFEAGLSSTNFQFSSYGTVHIL